MEKKYVKKVLTKLTKEEAAQELRKAWESNFGSATDRQIAIITAQWALETGWGSSMFNYNFGNIKGADPKTGMSTRRMTKEGYGKLESSEEASFRAYESASDGAEDYINFLYNGYRKAIECVQNEDPEGFVIALKDGGYFTGDPDVYLNSVTRIANNLSKPTEKKDQEQKPTKKPLVSFIEEMMKAMQNAIEQLI